MENKILNKWRELFVSNGIIELDSQITTSKMSNATYYVVMDVITHEYYRADHLIRDSTLSLHDTRMLLRENRILSPNFNDITEPFEINLCVSTKSVSGETVYFKVDHSDSILYFYDMYKGANAICEIGKVLRNEVDGIKEFTLAEIIYFNINDESISSILAKIHSFFKKIEIEVRYDQHPINHIDFYHCKHNHRCNCWSVELLNDGKWINCVNVIDRINNENRIMDVVWNMNIVCEVIMNSLLVF